MEPEQSKGETEADAPVTGEDGAAARDISLVIFRLGTQWFALPTQVVREVTEVRTIRSIPRRNTEVLLGLVNLRGELQLCVSFNSLLGLESEQRRTRAKDRRGTARLVVIEKGGDRWVFPADEVPGVFHFAPREFQEMSMAPAEGAALACKGMVRWLEKQVGYLDETVLFDTLKGCIS